jgi:organic hydroperoxide reductase OsmC/OhrA
MNARTTHITRKTDKQFFFEVNLNYLAGTRGILSAKDAEGTLHVATPPEFGGQGKPWTPEHFFLSSISGCFMTTYLVFAKKFQFAISNFECNAIGQVEIAEGKYKFTNINLFPKIYIADESLREKANLAVEKTHKYCLITNSLNAAVFYHTEVLVNAQRGYETKNANPLLRSSFSPAEIEEIGVRLGIDFKKYSLEEFKKGLQVELEHGRKIAETNITNDNIYLTAKIAWAHLHELPDYYTRLEKIEKEAEAVNNN